MHNLLSQLIIFLLFLIVEYKQSPYYFSNFYACYKRCVVQKNVFHPACGCANAKKLVNIEIVDDIVEFRKNVHDFYNNVRNRVASGKENGLPQGKNMMLVNYNLELEYFARCIGRMNSPNIPGCQFKDSTGNRIFKSVIITSRLNMRFNTTDLLQDE